MFRVYLDPPLSDSERRERLYRGDILVLSPTTATQALVELASGMLRDAFHPHDPRTIHRFRTAAEVAAVLADLKPRFIHHPECKEIIPSILADSGISIDDVYFDVPRLRSVYPASFLSAGIAYAYHPHRDTWHSAPMCQINWWLPVFGLDPNNAMAFYPRHFSEPVDNNSEIYNYYDWNTEARPNAAQHIAKDTRTQPKPQQELDQLKLSFLPPPAALILFSAAHLHDTTPNSTDMARYSIDFRTVHIDDLKAGRGAANVDSRCTGTTLRDFLRASDLEHLPADVIGLYDDSSSTNENVVLYFGERLLSRRASPGEATDQPPTAQPSPMRRREL